MSSRGAGSTQQPWGEAGSSRWEVYTVWSLEDGLWFPIVLDLTEFLQNVPWGTSRGKDMLILTSTFLESLTSGDSIQLRSKC